MPDIIDEIQDSDNEIVSESEYKKVVLKPTLMPSVNIIHSVEQPLGTYQLLIVKVKDGQELPETEFECSIRMFNQIYSKQGYIIKKK